MKTEFNTPCNDLDPRSGLYPRSRPSPDSQDHLSCQNINSFPVEVLYENQWGLTKKGNSWIDIKRSDPETNVMASIGIMSFTKCEEIPGLKLDGASVVPNLSKEECHNSEYWKQQFKNETVFLSFYNSQCYYSPEQTAILREDSSASIYIHSSSC